jgi:hypothetical protein
MKAITVLLYRNLLQDVYKLNALFCRTQQNDFWNRKYNYGTRLKKHGFSTHFQLLGVVDRVTTYRLPLHYTCLGYSPGCLPHQQILRKTFELYYYFYIVKKYVRYNNNSHTFVEELLL